MDLLLEKEMNRCGYKHQQQNAALVGLGCVGEMRAEAFSSFSMGMMAADSNGVVCPKPRRLVNVNDSISFRPSRLLHAKYVSFIFFKIFLTNYLILGIGFVDL